MAKKQTKKKALDDALKVLKQSFGAAYDTRAIPEDCYEAIPSGYDDLDAIATNGARGIYLGGLIEVYGPEGSGKTSFAMNVVAHAQKNDINCVWIDAEAGFSPDLAVINGIDLSSLVKPDLVDIKRKETKSPIPTAGEILNMVYDTVQTGAFGLIVIDSVAGMSSSRVLGSDYDPNKMGVAEVARAFSEQLGKLHHACANQNCSVLLINQIRMKPGDIWNPEDTPGGKAIKFFADQRYRVDRIGGAKGSVEVTQQDDSGDEVTRVIGHYARLRIVKNKKAPPSRDPIEIPIYYEHYDPDDAKKTFDVARSLQIITVRSGIYTWKRSDGEVIKMESEPEMLDYLRTEKLEPMLAQECMVAESGEKNQSKKDPIKVPLGVKDLAATYTPETKTDEKTTVT